HAHTAASAQGHHVFQGRPDFHPQNVRGGVQAHVAVHEDVLSQQRRILVLRGHHHTCGQPTGHLFGVGGAGEHHHRTAGNLLLNDLVERQTAVLFDALGHTHQHSARLEIGGNLLGGGTHGKGGGGQDHHLTVRQDVQVTGQLQLLGQLHP